MTSSLKTLGGLMVVVGSLSACSPPAASTDPIAGSLTAAEICQTVSQLITLNSAGQYQPAPPAACSAVALEGNLVEIQSAFTTASGRNVAYTALGIVVGDVLRMNNIKLHGIDEDYRRFADLTQ